MSSTFAFLVHPRDLRDVYIRFPILKLLPDKLVFLLLRVMPPVHVSNIRGLVDKKGVEIKGYVISIPLTAKQMIEDGKLTIKKSRQAVKFASKKGVKVIGLGGMVASLTRGGIDLAGIDNQIKLTSGRAYTVFTVTNYVKRVIDDFGLDKSKVKVAIVGAAGSIGSSCAELLVEWGIKDILLIDLERKLDDLETKIQHIKNYNKHPLTIRKSHKINEISLADIIIAATNAPEVVIKEIDLKPGSIVINDAQPSDVSPEVLSREDVLVIEGGVIRTPGIKSNFDFGLMEKEDNFCCLGEVIILSFNGIETDFSTGYLDSKYVAEIEKMSQKLGFAITKYQNISGYITDDKMNTVKNIIKKRYHD